MYLVIGTRLGLAYAIQDVSHYLNNYGKSQWESVKRIVIYTKGTSNVGLEYCGSNVT